MTAPEGDGRELDAGGCAGRLVLPRSSRAELTHGLAAEARGPAQVPSVPFGAERLGCGVDPYGVAAGGKAAVLWNRRETRVGRSGCRTSTRLVPQELSRAASTWLWERRPFLRDGQLSGHQGPLSS